MSNQSNNGHAPTPGQIHDDQREKAWRNLLTDLAPEREHRKPRQHGVTMILDRCQGLAATADELDMVGDYVDQIKLSFGTSVLLSEAFIRSKIELVRAYDIDIYPGGTLAEVMLMQGVYPHYLRRAKALGFTAIEVSDGTISMTRQVRDEAIKRALDSGFKVISEVGKKDARVDIPVAQLCEQVVEDLALGVQKVIVEARESGTGIGIYDSSGAIRQDKLTAMLEQLRGYEDEIMWEAPRTGQQAQLVMRFGPNVSLGNVKPRDVLGLEALRCGLRFETFRLFSPQLEPLESIGGRDG
jgi:phosphosulfolactate synthase